MSSLKKCSITKINHKKKGMFIEQILGVLMRSFLLEKAHGSIPRKKKNENTTPTFLPPFFLEVLYSWSLFLYVASYGSLSHTHTYLPRSSIEEKAWISCFCFVNTRLPPPAFEILCPCSLFVHVIHAPLIINVLTAHDINY